MLEGAERTAIQDAGLKLAIADQAYYVALIEAMKAIDARLAATVVGTDDHDELLRAQGAARHHRALLVEFASVFRKQHEPIEQAGTQVFQPDL